MLGCNDSGFSGGSNKKAKDAASLKGPGQGDGSPEVNCTGTSEEDCKALKPTPDTKSFREVDCTGKSTADCDKAKEEERQKDGELGSDIRVKGEPDGSDDEALGDIDTGAEEVVKKGRFYCIGGLGHNVAYVVKTAELAKKCLAFGNLQPCSNDVKCDDSPLIIFDCECDNPEGIPFVKTNQCYRTNPLKGGVKRTGCTAK